MVRYKVEHELNLFRILSYTNRDLSCSIEGVFSGYQWVQAVERAAEERHSSKQEASEQKLKLSVSAAFVTRGTKAAEYRGTG